MTADSVRRRLIVFARLPRLGRVKTRLAATIGDEAALAAYRRLLDRTLSTAAIVPVDVRELRLADPDWTASEDAALDPLRAAGWQIGRQCMGDLGARMADALESALAQRQLPILIGCDCPVLEVADLEAAYLALARNDAVFSPTEDGGYALVGISRSVPQAFRAVPWGTDEVMRFTRARLADAQVSWTELRTLWDVDVAVDLERWRCIDR